MKTTLGFLILTVLLSSGFAASAPLASAAELQAGPAIHGLTTNAADYPNGVIPRYARFELTFQVDTLAQNLQLPYDAAPPAGVIPELGVTVDALFTPDNWQTVYTQPAFYYQEFDDQQKSGQEWFYPTGNYSWKVRFAPPSQGTWQYRLTARDSSGVSESQAFAFTVGPSSNPGFVRVSARDPRYFEFENRDYFNGLGYNMNFNHVSWSNPVLDNQANFQAMSANGIQLVRIWLTEWGIYDVPWNPWNSIDPEQHAQYIPYAGTSAEQAYPGSDVSMKITTDYNECMFIGFMKPSPAVKRNTTYRVRVRYKTEDMAGPRVEGHPFGLVAKTGGWLWWDGNYCHDPGTGTPVTPYQSQNTSGWQILEGSLTTGEQDFLPNFYLALENATRGDAYIDYVWIEEDFGDGNYGPNIVSKPWMAHQYYMEQRNSYAFDKVLALAEQYDIYIRPVILEKNGYIFNRIDFEGNDIPEVPECWDGDPNNDPEKCPDNNWFYGNWRQVTKVRWLQQAWWRYLQARWGYSTSIHSWELLNEGDPWNSGHYTLADEFGRYMHQFQPNDHLVSTSFWHSFPRDDFWANPEYSHLDFADIHQYIPASDPHFNDSAAASYDLSLWYGALAPGGAGKPVIRGETGFTAQGSEPPTDELEADTDGIWLHNFLWAGLNPGGLIESYWYEDYHIYQRAYDGSLVYDHRDQYGALSKFLRGLPLSNGRYQDSAAEISGAGLQAWGQKDLTAQRAHLWIQNTSHTWRNVVDGADIPPVSGSLTLSGFTPGREFIVEWWDPYPSADPRPILYTQQLLSDNSGRLVLQVSDLLSDVAVKVYLKPAYTDQLFLPVLQRD